MRDAVIVEAVRSPIGKRNGGLAGTHAVEVSAQVLTALVARAGLDPELIDDVHWGNVISIGQQSGNIGRMAVLGAGWSEAIPGFTIDRQCGSSQQAISTAAATVVSGQADIIVAGGVEMMSNVPMGAATVEGTGQMGGPAVTRYSTELAEFPGFHGRFNQGAGAEKIAADYGLSRTQLDEYSVRSHERAAKAQAAGDFEAEITPITTAAGTVDADEGIRPGSSVEKLATLKAPFIENGVITAGNASQISDGAAALLITTSEKAAELGLTPIASSPLASGTLVGEATSKKLQAVAAVFDRIAAEQGAPRVAVVLSWLLHHPAGVVPIVSTSRVARIRQCAEATEVGFSRQQWYEVLAASRGQSLF